MVYADVPEHEGLNDGTAPEKAPRPISTDGWLERISDQLQVFVDKLNELVDEDSDEADTDQADGSGENPADSTGEPEKPATPAKKAPASKTTEVKGD